MHLNCRVGEDSGESLGFKEIKPVNTKWYQPWIFIGRTDAEAEAPIVWSPDVKRGLVGKDPDAGKDWRQRKKGKTEDEMFGWHYWLYRHEFEQTPGDSEGHVSLACCSQWGCKDLNTSEQKLSMALPTRARASFTHSQFLPPGSFHNLLSSSIRGQTEWKSQPQKTNQTDHMDHNLV